MIETKQPEVICDKPALVFIHIGKTGGATLVHWLSQYFPPSQTCRLLKKHQPLPPSPKRNFVKAIPYTSDLAEELLKYKFISGHFSFAEALRFPHPSPLRIMMLREPKKRIYSLYHYQKSLSLEGNNDPLRHAAHQHDFKSFLKLTGDLKKHFNNRYLSILTESSDSLDEDLSERNIEHLLTLAKKNLNQIDAVGILEKFSSSILLFAKILQLGEIDPQQVKSRNITESKKVEYSPLDDEINELLDKYTQYDQILYEYGQQIFTQQCAQYGI